MQFGTKEFTALMKTFTIKMHPKKDYLGYSLIEMVVILVVLSIIVSLASLRYVQFFDVASTQAGLEALRQAKLSCVAGAASRSPSKLRPISSSNYFLASFPPGEMIFAIEGYDRGSNAFENRDCFTANGSPREIFLIPKVAHKFPIFTINERLHGLCQNGDYIVSEQNFNIRCFGYLKISNREGPAAHGISASRSVGVWQ